MACLDHIPVYALDWDPELQMPDLWLLNELELLRQENEELQAIVDKYRTMQRKLNRDVAEFNRDPENFTNSNLATKCSRLYDLLSTNNIPIPGDL